jgi:hypothetical protein
VASLFTAREPAAALDSTFLESIAPNPARDKWASPFVKDEGGRMKEDKFAVCSGQFAVCSDQLAVCSWQFAVAAS